MRWLERQGYDVSYISSTDLDQQPAQLLKHKAFISIGHDEYWTLAMRQGVEQARDHGVGLAFLGANTGLVPGHSYGCGIVGYEWDRVWNLPNDPVTYKDATPKNIQILSSSRVVPHDGTTDGPPQYSNSAYYIASSGALVFASGSIYWGNALDNYRDIGSPAQEGYQQQLANACQGSASNSEAVPEIQKLMTNVMTALVVTHPSGHL